MNVGDIVTDGVNQYKVLSIGGSLYWLSKPDDFTVGMRMFTEQDLAAAGIHL